METQSERDILIAALREIADPRTPGNNIVCDCEHDTEDCCARVGYYCPVCVAGKALLDIGVDPYAD